MSGAVKTEEISKPATGSFNNGESVQGKAISKGQDDERKSKAQTSELLLQDKNALNDGDYSKSKDIKTENGDNSAKPSKSKGIIGSKLSLKRSRLLPEKGFDMSKINDDQKVQTVGGDEGNGKSDNRILEDQHHFTGENSLPSRERHYRHVSESEGDVTKYEGDLTVCPICKQELSTPKHLPCLHTFCESCIGDYFLKIQGNAKSFRVRCPVCREFQPGKRATIPAKDVAHLLPTNHFILNMVARKNMHNCMPCARGGITTPSECWCYFCTESLCADHAVYHDNLTSRNIHRVQSINDVSKDVDLAYLPGYCEVHTLQKLKFYCEDHDVAACDTCRKAYHRQCPGLVTTNSEAEELRHGEYVQDITDKLHDMERKSVDMLDKLSENLSDLYSYRINDEDSITGLRQKVTNHLDSLEKKLVNELALKQKEKEFEIQTQIGIFEKKRETLLFYKRLLELLQSEGLGVQIFLELPSIGRQSNILAEKMHHRAAIMQTSSIHVELNDIIVQLDSMGSVVEMNTKFKPEFPYVPGSGMRKLELQSPQPTPRMETLHKRLKQGFLVIRFQSSTISGATTIEGRLVLADYTSREIRAYYDNGNRDDSLNIQHLRGNPCDLVEVPTINDGYTLIISFPQQHKIMLLQWDDAVVFEQLHVTKQECYGVTNVGNSVIVACLKHLEFWKVGEDLSMKRKSVLQIPGDKVQNVHPADQNRIYYSDSCDGGSFYCINKDGTIVFEYNHPELLFPRGIATDRDGNIYIAGYKSNNIHKLSPEGELKQLIVPQIQLFYRPRVIVENGGSVFVVYRKHKVLELS